jgi:PPOX class probable F420-dependent enzyme
VITIPQSHLDLLDNDVATLATIGVDGRPQLTEVWFLAEEGVPRLSLNTARQKVKNLSENSACCLFILDLANTYRYLEIRGDAEMRPDDDYAFADRVGAKYQADRRGPRRPRGPPDDRLHPAHQDQRRQHEGMNPGPEKTPAAFLTWPHRPGGADSGPHPCSVDRDGNRDRSGVDLTPGGRPGGPARPCRRL